MNPFEPPRAERRRRPEPLGIRLLAIGMAAVGVWSAFDGLSQFDRIGYAQLVFAALCFGLAWITWEKR